MKIILHSVPGFWDDPWLSFCSSAQWAQRDGPINRDLFILPHLKLSAYSTSWLMSAMFNCYSPYHMYTQTEGSSSEINQALNSCQLMRKIGHEKFRKHSRCDTTVWFWKVCHFISLTESLKECRCWFTTFRIIIVRHAHSLNQPTHS